MKKIFVGSPYRCVLPFVLLIMMAAFFSCKKSTSLYQSHHDHQAYQAIHHIPKPVHIDPDRIITVNEINERQKAFIAGFLPLIHAANQSIIDQRHLLEEIRDDVRRKGKLNAKNLTAMNTLLFYYRLSAIDSSNALDQEYISGSLDSLLLRTDIIPERLAMAQAIIESGWGSSRFCALANNYFGVHCHSKGCGVKPGNNAEDNFEVKKYHSKLDAIRDYLRILNTGFAYEEFREKRAEYRAQDMAPDPFQLVNYLGRYSEKGSSYLALLKEIMKNYTPEHPGALLDD